MKSPYLVTQQDYSDSDLYVPDYVKMQTIQPLPTEVPDKPWNWTIEVMLAAVILAGCLWLWESVK